MKPVTVIGIGSPYGADRFGWQVIDYLKRDHALHTLGEMDVNLIACDRPGLSFLDYITDCEIAIIVDAIGGGRPGRIRCLLPDQLALKNNTISSHDAGVAEALKLGESLGLLPSKVIVYGIEIGENGTQSNIKQSEIEEVGKLIIEKVLAVTEIKIEFDGLSRK